MAPALAQDTTPPSILALSANPEDIDEADAGGILTIEMDFSENMNTSVTPVLSFPGEDPSATLTFGADEWEADDTVYRAFYSITDADQLLNDIELRVSGAEDEAGNVMAAESWFPFSINMANGTVTINKTVVGGDDGTFTFEVVDINSGETTDVFSITTSGGSGSTGPMDVSAGVFAVIEQASAGYALTSVVCDDPSNDSVVDLTQNGVALDIGIDEVIACTFTNTADGSSDDTAPEAVAILANPELILDPFDGEELTLEVQFSEAMDASIAPTISFPGADPSPSLFFLDGVWSSANTIYTATYEIFDADQYLPSVEVIVSGARDLAGKTMTAKSASPFSIAMASGALNLTKTVVGDDGSFPFTLTYVATGAVVGDFDLTTSGGTASFSEDDVPVGQYIITETQASGYTLTDIACTDPSNDSETKLSQLTATIDIGANETVSCTFTNTQDSAPLPTITGPVGPVNAAFDIDIKFSEAVTGFESADIRVTGASVTAFSGSETVYSATLTPTETGAITIEVPADVAQSSDGRLNLGSAPFEIAADLIAPTVQIVAPENNNGDPFEVEIIFSETVTGFELGDVTITGGSVNASASSTDQTFTLTPDINASRVTISVPAGSVMDEAGNANLAAEFASATSPQDNPPVLTLATQLFTPVVSAVVFENGFGTYVIARDELVASIEDENPDTVSLTLNCGGNAGTPSTDGQSFTMTRLSLRTLNACYASAYDEAGQASGRSVFFINMRAFSNAPRAVILPVTGDEGADSWTVSFAFDAPMDTSIDPVLVFTETLSEPVLQSGLWTSESSYQAVFTNGGDEFSLIPYQSVVTIGSAQADPSVGGLEMLRQSFTLTAFDLTPVETSCASNPISLLASKSVQFPGERNLLQIEGDVGGCTLDVTSDREDSFFELAPQLVSNRVVFEPKLTEAGPILFTATSTDDNGNQQTASTLVDVIGFSAFDYSVFLAGPATIQVSNDQQGFAVLPQLLFTESAANLAFYTYEAELSFSDPSLIYSVDNTPTNGAQPVAVDLRQALIQGIPILPTQTASGVLTATLAVTLTDYTGVSETKQASVDVEIFRGDPGIVAVPDGQTLDDGSDGVINLDTVGRSSDLLDPLIQKLANPGDGPVDVLSQSSDWIDVSASNGTSTSSQTLTTQSVSTLASTQFTLDGGETVDLSFDISGAIEAAIEQGLDGSITGEVHLYVDNASAAGTPDLSYIVTVELPALEGNLTISTLTRPAIAGDEVFSYTSNAPGFEELSLQTQSNGAASESVTLRAGRYDITQITPQGWALDAISCSGDSDNGSSYDVENSLAVIDLDVGETLVCVFENVRDEDVVQLATQRAIVNFLTQRAKLLASNRPDLMARARGTDPAGFGRLTGQGDDDRLNLRFASSLQGLRARQVEHERAQLTQIGRQSAHVDPDPAPWDVWIQASLARAAFEDDETGRTETESAFSAIYLGADFAISENTKLGAIISYDYISQDGVTNQADSEGTGWMIGPYLTGAHDDQLYYFARAAWGQSRNDISPLGIYFDEFSTDRYLIEAGLTGDLLVRDHANTHWRVSPEFGVYYFEETQHAYTDKLGYRIADNTVSLGEFTFGPSIATRRRYAYSGVLETRARVLGVWAFDAAEFMNEAGGFIGNSSAFTARVNAGLSWTSDTGTRISGSLNYDGIGNDAYQSYGGDIRISIPLGP